MKQRECRAERVAPAPARLHHAGVKPRRQPVEQHEARRGREQRRQRPAQPRIGLARDRERERDTERCNERPAEARCLDEREHDIRIAARVPERLASCPERDATEQQRGIAARTVARSAAGDDRREDRCGDAR